MPFIKIEEIVTNNKSTLAKYQNLKGKVFSTIPFPDENPLKHGLTLEEYSSSGEKTGFSIDTSPFKSVVPFIPGKRSYIFTSDETYFYRDVTEEYERIIDNHELDKVSVDENDISDELEI